MISGTPSIRRHCWAVAATAFIGTSMAAPTPAPTDTAIKPAPASAPAPAVAPTPPPPPPTLSTEQASYDFGLTFGEQLRHAGLGADLSIDAVSRGLKDGLGGKKIAAGEQQQMAQYIRSVRDAAGVRNKAAAKDFLTANGQKKGVKTTASGLQYKIIAPGDGKAASPTAEDQVVVQYRGKLLDGTEFDSSYTRGQPATFQAGRVIKGWQEALLLMKPGAKFELFVPPELAYDLNPPPQSSIPPGSLLLFDVELVSIQAAPKPN